MISVYGENFTADSVDISAYFCVFDTVSVPVESLNETFLTCTSPPSPFHEDNSVVSVELFVEIFLPSENITTDSAFYDYYVAPSYQSFSPHSGQEKDLISVSGQNFYEPAGPNIYFCLFENIEVEATWVSPEKLSCQLPEFDEDELEHLQLCGDESYEIFFSITENFLDTKFTFETPVCYSTDDSDDDDDSESDDSDDDDDDDDDGKDRDTTLIAVVSVILFLIVVAYIYVNMTPKKEQPAKEMDEMKQPLN